MEGVEDLFGGRCQRERSRVGVPVGDVVFRRDNAFVDAASAWSRRRAGSGKAAPTPRPSARSTAAGRRCRRRAACRGRARAAPRTGLPPPASARRTRRPRRPASRPAAPSTRQPRWSTRTRCGASSPSAPNVAVTGCPLLNARTYTYFPIASPSSQPQTLCTPPHTARIELYRSHAEVLAELTALVARRER